MKTVHWIGGVKHPRGVRLAGWPCCCSGPRCEKLAKQPELLTRDPELVTCKACLRMMQKDNTGRGWQK